MFAGHAWAGTFLGLSLAAWVILATVDLILRLG
jgi:uncharacterized membrane protein